MRVLWSILVPLLLVLVVTPAWAAVCPGGKVRCPEKMTCCELANHEYGCCIYPEAQCCRDRVHCCPNGMKCDERHQACLKNGFPAVAFTQTSVKPEVVDLAETDLGPYVNLPLETNHVNPANDEAESNTCPDGHTCPGSFTCCKMYRGHYGCCPYTDAQCCMDGFHCCPHGASCDPVTGGCLGDDGWLGKVTRLRGARKQTPKPAPSELADPGGKCPDGHPCLEKYTCCHKLEGGYGCCPYTNGVCCTDLVHCCPQDTNCNTTTGTCDKGGSSVPAFSLLTNEPSGEPKISEEPAVVESEVAKVEGVCPDKKSECNPGNTCCKMVDGSYGCCPFAEATCCPDQESCCPNGYECAPDGTCQRLLTLDALPFLSPKKHEQKPSALPSEERHTVEEEDVNCPDGSSCPDQSTCCSISATTYGCCPMPLATCCGDMQHCCPHGYWCSDEGCERVDGGPLNKTIMARDTHTANYPSVMMAP